MYFNTNFRCIKIIFFNSLHFPRVRGELYICV
jgi:hypothetical protein